MKSVKDTILIAMLFSVSFVPVCSGQESGSEAKGLRVLRFPEGYSVGRIYFRDRDVPMDWRNSFRDWGRWVEATGKINVPLGKAVRLDPYKITWRGGWALSTLKPDDIQFLTFLWYKDADDSVMKDIGRLTGLEGLYLSYCDGIGTGLKYLAGLKKLRFLSIPGQLKGEDLAYLAELPSLDSLNFGGPMVTDTKMVHIGKLTQLTELGLGGSEVAEGLVHLKGLKSLRFLNLRCNRSYDIDDGLRHIGGLAELEELNLRETAVSDVGLAHLSGLKKLRKLNLFMTRGGITDAGMAHLKNLRSLQELQLPSAGITDVGFSHLAVLDSLRKVNLGRHIADKTMATLARMKSLEGLYITSRNVTDAGMAEFGNSSSLKSLTLNRCSVTDAGLAHLAKLKSLSKLSIVSMPITDAGLAHLAKIKSLTTLRIDRAKVTGEGLAALKELPHLTDLDLDDIDLGEAGISNIAGLSGITRLFLHFPESMHFGDDDLAQLSAMSSLKLLSVTQPDASRSAITNQGLAHLSSLTGLEDLSLSTNCQKVTDAGLKHLEGLSKLKHLSLSKSRITMAGVARLKEKIPDVVVTAPCTMAQWNRKLKAIEAGRPFDEQRSPAK